MVTKAVGIAMLSMKQALMEVLVEGKHMATRKQVEDLDALTI